MTNETAQKLIQKVLPSFKVVGTVGKGSFGAVYRIKDDLKERVAKVIPLAGEVGIEKGAVVSADTKVERDFRHIVDSYERIACDEIVTVYDFYMVKDGEAGGKGPAYAVVVMEIYPTSLAGYVVGHYEKTGGPLDILVARKVMEKVAMMLGNLYTKMGFLFEDFKPENLLIKEQAGDLKIVVGDIGGLKNIISIALTASQVTPVYCAPEVIRKGQPPDLRSIVYSYGLLCFYVLEGHLPYDDRAMSARFELIKQNGLPFSRTDVPDSIKRVIEKCLAFEQNQRFRSFEDVVQGIRGQIIFEVPEEFSAGTINVGGGASPGSDFSTGTITVPGSAQGRLSSSGIAGSAQGSGTMAVPGTRMTVASKIAPEKNRLDSVSILDEKDQIEKIEKEIKSRSIKRGESFKITNESVRITGNIIVDPNAVLSIVNSKIFFAENSGLIVLGALRARGSVFSAMDSTKRWNNVTIFSTAAGGVSVIESCRFHFGRGINGKVLKDYFNINRPFIHDSGFYGGGLFIAGGKDRTLTLKGITCFKCSAYDGGGMLFFKSAALLDGGLFEGCSSTNSGGAISCVESTNVLKGCTFNKCLAGKDGGGVSLLSSNASVEDSLFRGCMSKYYGGGVACTTSSPALKGCRFEHCASSKAGGGIFCDKESKPKITFPSFLKCKPNDINIKI